MPFAISPPVTSYFIFFLPKSYFSLTRFNCQLASFKCVIHMVSQYFHRSLEDVAVVREGRWHFKRIKIAFHYNNFNLLKINHLLFTVSKYYDQV